MSEPKKTEREIKGTSIWWFIGAALIVVTIWLYNVYIYPLSVEDLATRAQVGDSFGAVNALFSGLAFAGLIYTIMMQRKELQLQREELAMQRQEMRDSRGELERQNQIQKAQAEIMIAQVKASAAELKVSFYRQQSATGTVGLGELDSEIERVAKEVENMGMSLGNKYLPLLGVGDEQGESLDPPPEE